MRWKSHILAVSLAVILLLGAGCGKKGPPMPERLAVPGGIKDLRGEVREGVLFLSFSIPSKDSKGEDIKDLAGFRILRTCGSCIGGFEPFREIRLEDNQGYTVAKGRVYVYDDDLKEGLRYSYRVHPMTVRGSSGEASNVFTITWRNVPPPPGEVTAKGGNERVELTWTKEGTLLYNVYRLKENVYPLFPINPGPLATTFFVDSGLKNGKTYRYEVRSVLMRDGIGWEGEGVTAVATPMDRTPPEAPREIKTERRGRDVRITWKMNKEADILGYNVYRTSGGRTLLLNAEPVRKPVFLDKSVPDARYVSYYVTALDRAGNESEHSKESIIILMKE